MLLKEKKSEKMWHKKMQAQEEVGGTLYVRVEDESGFPREAEPIGWIFISLSRYTDISVCAP